MVARQLGEAEERSLRRLCAEGATLTEMSRQIGIRMTDLEEHIRRLGIDRATSATKPATNGTTEPKRFTWRIVPPGHYGLYVTVNAKTGVLYLSRGAQAILDAHTHIVVLWAPAERCIGIRAAEAGEPGARRMVKQFSLRSLIADEGLELSGRYPARMDGDVLVVPVERAVSA